MILLTVSPLLQNRAAGRRARASDSDSISYMTAFRKRNLPEFVRFAYALAPDMTIAK